MPLVTHYRSSLAAFVVTGCALFALCFVSLPAPLGFVVGFATSQELRTLASSSLLLFVLFVALRLGNVPRRSTLLDLFALPVLVLGGATFFLVMVGGTMFGFVDAGANARAIGALVVALFVGETFHIRAVASLAYTFAALYALLKFVELLRLVHTQLSVTALLFLGSLALYVVAMFLSNHPTLALRFFSARRLLDTTGL